MTGEEKIVEAMGDAEKKAWEALAGYKFWMFGYHCGRWVNYNKLLMNPRPNPFTDTVRVARAKMAEAPR
ncbi:MAG TPA: hypothetical protein VGJ92_04875 [Methanocella sp.]|jgi:hypothetical protein